MNTPTEARNTPRPIEELLGLAFIVLLVTSPGWLVALVQAMETSQ